MITPILNKTYQPNFKANLSSARLNLTREDFFIKIKGFGKNEAWADIIIKTTDNAVNQIRENINFEQMLKAIVRGVKEANLLTDDSSKKTNTGTLRTKRIGWFGGEESDAYTCYKNNRYSCYKQRLDSVAKKPLKRVGTNLALSRPDTRDIVHGEPFFINNSLDHIFKIFNNVIPKYIHGELKSENLKEANDAIAEIRWIMAHATPWKRGSDAISNVLMRAMYKAIGIKAYPPKEGLSFDLEAYCTDLEDYKKSFASYFEKAPEIIE